MEWIITWNNVHYFVKFSVISTGPVASIPLVVGALKLLSTYSVLTNLTVQSVNSSWSMAKTKWLTNGNYIWISMMHAFKRYHLNGWIIQCAKSRIYLGREPKRHQWIGELLLRITRNTFKEINSEKKNCESTRIIFRNSVQIFAVWFTNYN